MGTRWFAAITLGAAMLITGPNLMADRDKEKHKGNPHGYKHHGDDDDDRGWERREGYEYRAYGDRDERPPGWSHGKKTGWGNCGLPPGQAKKYGCRTYVYRGRPHYYYQDEQGRIIVRRPVIEVHGSVDIVR
jgi:hypothetical protein